MQLTAWAIIDKKQEYKIPICFLGNVEYKDKVFKPWAIFGTMEEAIQAVKTVKKIDKKIRKKINIVQIQINY